MANKWHCSLLLIHFPQELKLQQPPESYSQQFTNKILHETQIVICRLNKHIDIMAAKEKNTGGNPKDQNLMIIKTRYVCNLYVINKSTPPSPFVEH